MLPRSSILPVYAYQMRSGHGPTVSDWLWGPSDNFDVWSLALVGGSWCWDWFGCLQLLLSQPSPPSLYVAATPILNTWSAGEKPLPPYHQHLIQRVRQSPSKSQVCVMWANLVIQTANTANMHQNRSILLCHPFSALVWWLDMRWCHIFPIFQESSVWCIVGADDQNLGTSLGSANQWTSSQARRTAFSITVIIIFILTMIIIMINKFGFSQPAKQKWPSSRSPST